MSRKSLVALALFVVLVLFIVGINIVYQRGEMESNKHSVATCELISLGEILNEYFLQFKNYPDPETLVSSVKEKKLADLKCGRKIKINDQQIIDPWGTPYIYNKISENLVELYSYNSTYTKLILNNGKIQVTE